MSQTIESHFREKLQSETTPFQLRENMALPSLLVLDVRDPEAYAREHIHGALNIPLAELPRRWTELPKDKTVVCYCWSLTCFLATKAALELAHHGLKVQELRGGIAEWKRAGYDTENAETRGEAQY